MKDSKKQISIDFCGKIPPQALDIEEAILGGLMLEKEAIDKINIRPEYFYKDAHQKIFASIQKLASRNDSIDIMTVSEELRKDGFIEEVGGPYYVSVLSNKVASASNIEYHALILTDKFIKRELIRISSEIQSQAFDDSTNTFDVFDEFYSQLDAINNEVSEHDEVKNWNELVRDASKELIHRSELFKDNKITGIPTPILKLTKNTGGWQPQQLVIIAGRPSMGKTAVAIASMKTAAFYGFKVAFFSLEMSSLSLANRMIIGESGVDSDNFRAGNLTDYDWNSVDRAIGKMNNYNILIDDRPKSVNRIRAKVKSLHRKGLCDMVILDYLQLSWDDNQKNSMREQEVSMISRKLKLLAKELNIPVIALSQLNRSVENRPSKKPQLSDLRESGAIEQDADVVIFIHRPEKYGIFEDDEGNSLRGVGECIIEKQREGKVGTIKFKYNESLTSIYDFEDYKEQNRPYYDMDKNIEPNIEFDKF